MAAKDIDRISEEALHGKSRDYWESVYKIGKYANHTTTYRAAAMVSNDVFLNEDPNLEKTRHLAERDREFCQRLQDDEQFRIKFCERGGVLYEMSDKSREEQLIQDSIDESITERVDLVLTQKVLLGKYFHLLSDSDKVSLHQLVDNEITFMYTWMKSRMKNYKKLRQTCQQISAIDFFSCTDEGQNPTYPLKPYKFED